MTDHNPTLMSAHPFSFPSTWSVNAAPIFEGTPSHQP